MGNEPTVLNGVSAHTWTRVIYGVFGLALVMIFIGAVSIGVHALVAGSRAGDVALLSGKVCAWGIFFSLVAEVGLVVAMNARARRERKHGYATIRTDSDVPLIKQP